MIEENITISESNLSNNLPSQLDFYLRIKRNKSYDM